MEAPVIGDDMDVFLSRLQSAPAAPQSREVRVYRIAYTYMYTCICILS